MATVSIPLHSRKYPGRFAIVDEEDYPIVANMRWYPRTSGYTLYACANVYRDGWQSGVKMHRLILNAPDGMLVDHKNGDGLDNRRENIRLATDSQNQQNRTARSRDGLQFKGVMPDPRSPTWRAQIKIDGRLLSLGRYATAEDAARAYDTKARELFGEFARLNFPELTGCPPRYCPAVSSRYRGVHFDTIKGRWRALVYVGKKRNHVGYFDTEIEAARAYDVAAIALRGDAAKLNFL